MMTSSNIAATLPMAGGALPARVMTVNALAVGFVAGALEQIGHEATHGVLSVLVGQRWETLNLFAMHTSGDVQVAGEIISRGGAAIFNIVCGLACMAVVHRRFAQRRPLLRLFFVLFGAFSLLAGFGYLLTDPLFYSPTSDAPGDWKYIVRALGGGWEVRVPIAAVGLLGVLSVFFWLPRAALRFVVDPRERRAVALRTLLLPYLVVCAAFTLFAVGHPLGPSGVLLMVFKYWLGYSAVFWAFFIGGFWMKVPLPYRDASRLPPRVSVAWCVAAATALAAALVLLLAFPIAEASRRISGT